MVSGPMKTFLVEFLAPMFYLVSPYKLALNKNDAPPKFILKAMPMFILFPLLEALIGRLRRRSEDSQRRPKYRLRDVVCSLSCGLFEESFSLAMESVGLKLSVALYALVHRRCRLFSYDARKHPLLTFVGLFLGVDLAYYTVHRVNHEFHALWAAHRVHHSGEDYNMATALRQSIPQRLTAPFFYLPLALVFNPVAFAAHYQLNTIFQFWYHTELVGWLGPLEYIFQTPAAHRMHHRVPGNCNYGGVLVVWDRIFGTYRCENDEGYWDNFGLAKSPETFSALELHLGHWRRLAKMPGSWLRKLATQRPTDTRWVFQPLELFKPLPAPKAPQAREARSRYQGEPMSQRDELLVSAAAALAGLRFISLALSHESKSRTSVILGTSSVVAALASAGRCLSQGVEGNRSSLSLAVAATAASAAL